MYNMYIANGLPCLISVFVMPRIHKELLPWIDGRRGGDASCVSLFRKTRSECMQPADARSRPIHR